MDTKERHIRENESLEKRVKEERRNGEDLIAESLPAQGRERKREHTRRTNRLWLWLGVIILIFILIYWLFSIGIIEDLMNVFNG